MFEEESIIAKLDNKLNRPNIGLDISTHNDNEEDNTDEWNNTVVSDDPIARDIELKHIERNCDINLNENEVMSNHHLEKEKFDKVAATLFESDESAEYTDPESANSSSTDESKESSIAPTQPTFVAETDHIPDNSAFQSNRYPNYFRIHIKN